ncbi:MAG: DUF2490 domain-containing protein [Limnobacter sp.]|uniref:DUF2490 domain-containing protein n=1 Tax=Limnobacter sp. TaxID=2003368 RepID=UPI00391DF4DF
MNASMTRRLASALLLGCVGLAPAAHANQEDNRLWSSLITEGQLGSTTRWFLEIQNRLRDDATKQDQLIVRPAVSYALTDRSTLWLGYAHVETRNNQGSTSENRLWQQYQVTGKWDTLNWLSRTRLEQRDLQGQPDQSHRLRQMIRFSHPVSQGSAWSYLGWNELFINLNDTNWAGGSGINQNRAFAGMLFKTSDKSRIEFGYLNQVVNVTTGRENQTNHIASVLYIHGF